MRTSVVVIAAAAALSGLASPAQAQAAQCGKTGIYLFSAHWCRYCKETEAFLQKNRVSFQRIEVTKNPQAQKYMMENYGTNAVPIMVVDSSHIVGYDEDWIRDELCFGRPGDARNRAQPATPSPTEAPTRAAAPSPARNAASVGTALEAYRSR